VAGRGRSADRLRCDPERAALDYQGFLAVRAQRDGRNRAAETAADDDGIIGFLRYRLLRGDHPNAGGNCARRRALYCLAPRYRRPIAYRHLCLPLLEWLPGVRSILLRIPREPCAPVHIGAPAGGAVERNSIGLSIRCGISGPSSERGTRAIAIG